jgi:DNA-directed RNA polymerase subunit alpha
MGKMDKMGKKEKCEKLILDIITNGTNDPEMVLSIAAKILYEQLKIFIKFEDYKEIEEKKKNMS